MTDIIRIQATIERDGEVHLSNLPVKRGQQVELSIQITSVPVDGPRLTAQQLLASDLLGMWQDRMDIGDSITYARELRERAQRRER